MKILSKKICASLTATTLLFASAAPLRALEQSLPDLGDASGSLMTPAQERRLGQAFMRSIRASEKVEDDPLLADYIQQLGHKLVQQSEAAGDSFDFFLLDNPQINAFAGPGGHIGVFSGLALTARSESELAAVLAHEIAHVTQKHLLRTFHQASQMSVPSAAVLLAAVVLGATVGGDAGVAAAAAGQGALLQQQINFTRHNEQEADRVGMHSLFEAGFEPHAMPLFFERMGRATQTFATELPEFLRTHPVTTNRIADSLGRADQLPYRQHRDDVRFHLMQATLKVRGFLKNAEAIHYYRSTLNEKRYLNEEGQRYGLVLALMRDKQWQAALQELGPLLNKRPQQTDYLIQQARLLNRLGQQQKALDTLRKPLELRPLNYPMNLEYARLLRSNGQPQQALELILNLVDLRPNDAALFKLAAEIANQTGDKAMAYSYQAQQLYLNGELESAARQLDTALRQPGLNDYDAARLQALREKIQTELNLLRSDRRTANPK